MNFDDTPQEAAFRAEAKAWIAANAPKQYEEELRKTSLGRSGLKNANMLEVAKAWQKKKADAGWACLHWPKEYGQMPVAVLVGIDHQQANRPSRVGHEQRHPEPELGPMQESTVIHRPFLFLISSSTSMTSQIDVAKTHKLKKQIYLATHFLSL